MKDHHTACSFEWVSFGWGYLHLFLSGHERCFDLVDGPGTAAKKRDAFDDAFDDEDDEDDEEDSEGAIFGWIAETAAIS